MKKAAVNPAAIVVLLAMLGALVFYVLEVTPSEREALIDVEEYSNVILDVSPGVIEEVDEDEIDKITKSLGEVTISNTAVEDLALLSDQLFVRRSVYSEEPAIVGFKITGLDTFQQASLSFFAEGSGSLIIHLNGRQIYLSPVSPGQQVIVPLDTAYLTEGFNEIRFSVSGPGVEFWRVNNYLLNAVNIITLTYPGEEVIEEQSFVLTESDLESVDRVDLTAFALKLSTLPSDVTIFLNDNLLYESKVQHRASLNIPVPVMYLNTGANKLTWMVEKDGAYKFSFISFVIESLPLEKTEFYSFEISPRDYQRVIARRVPQGVPAYGCFLNITRSGGARTINIRVNSQSYAKTFTAEEKISFDICEAVREGSNIVSLSAEDSVALDRMTFEIRNL